MDWIKDFLKCIISDMKNNASKDGCENVDENKFLGSSKELENSKSKGEYVIID